MELKEAKQILKQNGFILEDEMHDRAMARVDKAYQHAKDRQFYDLDPLRSRHGSEDWEEGGHAEYDYTSKDDSDGDEKEEFGRKVAKKLVDYFKPIYAKRGYVPDEYGGGDDNWDWTIKDILDKFMYHAVGEDKKLSFMGVDEAVKYVIPTAYKVLEQCWDKKANWFDIYKYRYIDIKEAKEILNDAGFILESSQYDYEYELLKQYFPDAKGAKIQRDRTIKRGNFMLLYGWECEFYLNGKRHWFSFGKGGFGFEPSLKAYIKKYCKLDSFADYQEFKKEYPDATLEDIREIAKMG